MAARAVRWRQLDPALAAASTLAARWLGAGRGPWRVGLGAGAVTVEVRRVGLPAPPPADAAAARVRGAGGELDVVGSGPLVRAVAQRLLGGPAELPAPRAPTLAEEGAWIAAVALALGPARAVEVDVADVPVVAVATIELALAGDVAGTAWLRLPADAPARPGRADAGWLAMALPVQVELARCRLGARDLVGLAARDAIAFPGTVGRWARPGPAPVRILVGGGGLAAQLTVDGRAAMVTSRYSRAMDDELAAELPIELRVVVATASVPARTLLGLAPDAVVPLARPADGACELWVGARRLGRGELVDVGGELAVRVVSLDP